MACSGTTLPYVLNLIIIGVFITSVYVQKLLKAHKNLDSLFTVVRLHREISKLD
jgi:hypothetical protein